MPILGEAGLDPDGALHGWCWDSQHPQERLLVDVLINGDVVASVTASRFREDVRDRKFGDGYHGFYVILTKQLDAAPGYALISLRERKSGYSFWRKTLGEFSLPDGFPDRLSACQAEIGRLAWSPVLAGPGGGKSARVGAALAALGARLRERAGKPSAAMPLFSLKAQPRPALSVIMEAGTESDEVFTYLRRAAQPLGQAQAQVILADGGADPQVLRRQAGVKNLCYLYCPNTPSSRRRNLAIASAAGETVLFLNPAAAGRFSQLWQALSPYAAERLVISGAIAETLKRVAPGFAGNLPEVAAPAGHEVQLAFPKHFIRSYGGFDEAVDDDAGLDILDWVLRAAKAGAPLAVWKAPWVPDIPPVKKTISAEAGRVFAERWILARV